MSMDLEQDLARDGSASRRRLRVALGVSAMAMTAAIQAAPAQAQSCPGSGLDICVIEVTEDSQSVTTQGSTHIVNSAEGTTITQPSGQYLLVENEAGASLAALSLNPAGAVQPGFFMTGTAIVNSGTIEGDLVLRGNGAVYVDAGGVVTGSITTFNGNASIGTPQFAAGFTTQTFIDRNGGGIAAGGVIDPGIGVDNYLQGFAASGTYAIPEDLPLNFEVGGVEVLGSTSVVTIVNETEGEAANGLSVWGDGAIVNRAIINSISTIGSGLPTNAPGSIAVSYGGVVGQSGTLFIPQQSQQPGAPPTYQTLRFGGALSSFVNEGVIAGDLNLRAAEFINSGEINRPSFGPGTLIMSAADQDFSFVNTGDIVVFAEDGTRPASLTSASVTLATALDATQTAAVSIDNSGTISGGLAFAGFASDFVFDNSGTINIQPNLYGMGSAVEIDVGELDFGDLSYLFEQIAIPEEFLLAQVGSVVADSATFINSGTIQGGIDASAVTHDFAFVNTGTINFDPADEYGESISLSADSHENEDGVETDVATASFDNSGQISGKVELEFAATEVDIVNSGSIVHGLIAPADLFPGNRDGLELDVETILSATVRFENSGTISTVDHAGDGVVIVVEASGGVEDGVPGAAASTANVEFVNSGVIRASGGNYVTPGNLIGMQQNEVLWDHASGLAVHAEAAGGSTVSIVNAADGVIDARGPAYTGTPNGPVLQPNQPETAGGLGIVVSADNVTIVNAGTVRGTAGTPSLTLPNGAVLIPNSDLDFEDEIGGGIDTFAGADRIVNEVTGRIEGGISTRSGDDTLINRGTIAGNIRLGAGDDVLELSETSIIQGLVDLGDGDDRVVLNASAGATAIGTVVSTSNAEALSVQRGNWRASGTQSAYSSVAIAQGAALTVAENAAGETAIATPLVELAGRLNLELATDTEAGDLADLLVRGAGSLHLTGEAVVLVDDANGLQHTGGTFVENGELLLTGEYAGTIATSGDGVFRLGESGDFTGDLVNNGTFAFSRAGDYSFLGDFSGAGLLEKDGAGTLTFAGLYSFTGTTTILGGAVAFTGGLDEDTELELGEDTVVDLSQIESGEQTIAQLSGTGGTLQLGETALIIQQFGDTVFAGSITGMGELIKDGDGDLKLNGDGTGFTGTGQVDGGTLSVNGDFSNASFVVNEGGTLGGAGTIGDTTVTGGTLAPGNSIDTLTVAGDIAFTAASAFEVEVDAAGNSDLLQATGTATLGGASVNVVAQSGAYQASTDYTILTAAGGVSGTFGSVDINLAFLDPSLSYSANAVTLRLMRNDLDFSEFGETPNQVAIANLLESLGLGNALYDATLTLVQNDVAPSFASLTGEVYPAYGAGILETAEILRRQTAPDMAGSGTYVWGTGLFNNVDSGGAPGGIELRGHGVAGGFGFGGNGLSVSAGLGILGQSKGGADLDDGDVTFAIGQVAYNALSGLSLNAGVQIGWVDASTRRQTAIGTVGGAVGGDIEGNYVQLFGEAGYRLAFGGVALEPFVGISHVALDLDPVTEAGAPTALTVAAIERDVTFGRAGLRVSGDAEASVRPFASAAYRRAWGDRASVAAVGFAGNPATALIAADAIARSGAELAAGVAVSSGVIDVELGYDGTIAKGFDSHGLKAGLKFRF